MNEDQASALFAPARERPVPPAAFSMADVFAADHRRRQRHGWGAVAGTVAVVVAVVVGSITLSGTVRSGGRQSAVTGATTVVALSLDQLMARVRVPADAHPVSSVSALSGLTNIPYSEQPGYQERHRFWTTRLSAAEALKVMTGDLPQFMAAAGTSTGTNKGLANASASFRAPETATLYGPGLELYAQVLADGSTALSATAWQIPKPAKTSADLVEQVSSVTATATDAAGKHTATVTGAAAQQLGRELDALWVKLTIGNQECGANPTFVLLAFHTASGIWQFQSGCGGVSPTAGASPMLLATPAFNAAVSAAFAGILPTPAPSIAPQPPGAAGTPPSLSAVLAAIPVPPGSTPVSASASGLSEGMTVGSDPKTVRQYAYWTSPLSRPATVSWLNQHLPSTWQGGFDITVGSNESDAMLNGAVNPTEDGPNLIVSVVDRPSGSVIRVQAWADPLAAKSSDETLTNVSAVTLTTRDEVAPATQPPLQTVRLNAAQISQLVADLNTLPVHADGTISCTEGSPQVIIDFATDRGERRFLYDRNCRVLSLLHTSAPGLSPSAALYNDVAADLAAATGPVRGTLVASISVSDHAARGGHRFNSQGSITIKQNGGLIKTSTIADGHSLTLTEPPGTYEVSAVTRSATCVPNQITVVGNQQADVEVQCHAT